MEMRYLMIISLLIIMFGCSQKDDDVVLVQKFWEAAQNKDVEALKVLISKPEIASMFAEGNGISIDVGEIQIGKKLENGNVGFTYKRFCYPEVASETKLVRIDGVSKVDVMATFKAKSKDANDIKPMKKYCYPFEDKQMTGKISGVTVTFIYLNKSIVNFGTHEEESYELTTEPCAGSECLTLKTPKILIHHLDFNNDGGNFNNAENITLFTPPHFNEFITEGSYRVTKSTPGNNKLEISFEKDKDNYINGYITY